MNNPVPDSAPASIALHPRSAVLSLTQGSFEASHVAQLVAGDYDALYDKALSSNQNQNRNWKLQAMVDQAHQDIGRDSSWQPQKDYARSERATRRE